MLRSRPMPEPLAVVEHAEVLTFTARLVCAESALLQDTARSIRTDSLILKVRAQEVRGARSLNGASDLDGIPIAASLSGGAALCGDCLARRTGVPHWKMSDVITRVRATVHVIS